MSDLPNFTSQRDGWPLPPPRGLPSVSSTMPALPHRTLEVAPPKLDFEFRMAARLKGEVCRVRLRNEEVRDLSVVEGGEWVAGFGRGTVRVSSAQGGIDDEGVLWLMGQSGGHDLQTGQPPERSRTRVDTAFELETSDDPPAV